MTSFQEQMDEYKKQIENGTIKQAYQQLMEYMMELRTYFAKKYPDYNVSGSIYSGYMDMSYFAIIPKSIKQHKLKIAIVFIHDTCRFEVWLSAANKTIQKQYWEMIKDSGWNKYRSPITINGFDSIIEKTIAESPDFNDLDTLTKQIEKAAIGFIADVENYLSK